MDELWSYLDEIGAGRAADAIPRVVDDVIAAAEGFVRQGARVVAMAALEGRVGGARDDVRAAVRFCHRWGRVLWFDGDMPDVAFVDPQVLTDVMSNFVSTRLDRAAPDCGRFLRRDVEETLRRRTTPPLLIVPGLLSAQIGADAAEIKRGRKVVVALNFVGGGLPLDASNRVLTRLSRSAHAIWHQALLFGAPDGAPDGGVVVEMAAEAVRITAASVESFGAARRAGDEIERLLWGHFRGLGYRIDVELGDDTNFVRRTPDDLLQALLSNPA
ncbi:MAG: hypothetical protein FD124_3989, partial [Alphaproteobacteria bacterium]